MTGDRSWFFPDCYLREMELLCRELRRTKGEPIPETIPLAEVLVMAQAFGAWKQGQVEKAGGIAAWLRGERLNGRGRVEQRHKSYRKALDFVSAEEADHDEPEVTADPAAEAEAANAKELAKVWSQLQDIYAEHAPKTWPQLVRRSKLGKMGTRLQEGIDHAGGVDEFLALVASALKKVPDFYRETYVRKGARLRPVTDCILCLLSGDKHHKDLGVSGWRMFEWADLMDAGEVTKPGLRHPSEEFLCWTGTRWTYRRPDLDDDTLELHRQRLIDANLGPKD